MSLFVCVCIEMLTLKLEENRAEAVDCVLSQYSTKTCQKSANIGDLSAFYYFSRLKDSLIIVMTDEHKKEDVYDNAHVYSGAVSSKH